jgi:hypothetical protein
MSDRGETVHHGIGSPQSKMPGLVTIRRVIFGSIRFICICEQRS